MIAPAFPALRRIDGDLPSRPRRSSPVHGSSSSSRSSRRRSGGELVPHPRPRDRERCRSAPTATSTSGSRSSPTSSGPPPPLADPNDLALADTLGVAVVSVVDRSRGDGPAALDSLARALDLLRRDSTRAHRHAGLRRASSSRCPGRTFNDTRRLATIERVVRRLRPDILLPARGPVRRRHARRGPARAAVLGELPHARRGHRQARPTAHVRIGVVRVGVRPARQHALRVGRRDAARRSTSWASRSSRRAAASARSTRRRDAADRWMRESNSHEGSLDLRRRRLSPKRTARRARSAPSGPRSRGRRAARDQGPRS